MAIETPTVFVLGAGASQPYGFPLGIGLRDLICKELTQPDLRFFLEDLGHKESTVRAFGQDLQHSAYTSVDAFLEATPEYLAVGKAAIAAVLLPLERHANLFPPRVAPSAHWYEHLVGHLGIGTSEWRHNRLTILTFNYDRSFEHYFATVIQTRVGTSATKAADLLARIQIVHLHGQLGNYPGLGSKPIPYGGTAMPKVVAAAARGIKVISEAGDDLTTFRVAREHLLKAQRVYFLGFGYARTSLERFEVFTSAEYQTWSPVALDGTSKGLPERHWDATLRDVFGRTLWTAKRYRRSVADFLKDRANLW